MSLQRLDRTQWSYAQALDHVQTVTVARRAAEAAELPPEPSQQHWGSSKNTTFAWKTEAETELLVALRDGDLLAHGRYTEERATRWSFDAELRARVPELAVELMGRPSFRTRQEWRWGRKGSLSMVIAGAKAGVWFDHEAGQGGGFADLVVRHLGLSRRDGLDWIAERIGMEHRPRPTRPRATPRPAPVEPPPPAPQSETETEASPLQSRPPPMQLPVPHRSGSVQARHPPTTPISPPSRRRRSRCVGTPSASTADTVLEIDLLTDVVLPVTV